MERILVIEDEKLILENIVETLEMEGFEVRGAENGRIGLETARSYRPDLILCDIMMPEFNGYEVLIYVRSEPPIANIPFIFLTALASRQAMREGMIRGADDYLTKPFSPDELIEAVNVRLEKHRAMMAKSEAKVQYLRESITYALPHELRTPLTGLIGCADFLMMDYRNIEPENLYNIAEVVMRSATRLQHVVENYLLYAQLELLSTEPERVTALRQKRLDYPEGVIYQIATAQAAQVDRAPDIRIDAENATITMSHDDLNKIMLELIDNALKFSKTGTDVVINAKPEDDYYVITVTDEGRGLSEEQITEVDAYVQFERKQHEQQGLGLGLAIIRRITELHGGLFSLESKSPDERTQTTTVRVSIPLVVEEAPAGDTANGKTSSASD